MPAAGSQRGGGGNSPPRLTLASLQLRSWGIVALATVLTVALRLTACVSEEPTPSPSALADYDAATLLQDLGGQVILPSYRAFSEAAQQLNDSSTAWAAALSAGQDADSELAAAQEAWRVAIYSWQRAELMQLGPAAPSDRVGGQDLRDAIYSWPTVNPCRIDQEITSGGFEASAFFNDSLVNVYGLDALEYLLFFAGEDNACPAQVAINNEGSWLALGGSEIDRRRAAYAALAAQRLGDDAAALVSAWEPLEGDFLGSLAAAGGANSAYLNSTAALQDVFDALFYLELVVKDQKLSQPLIDPETGSQLDVDALESQFAGSSVSHIAANLAGFLALIEGGGEAGSLGFADLLNHVGQSDLGDTLIDNAHTARDGLDALLVAGEQPPTFDQLQAVWRDVKATTDLLKVDVQIALFLDLPGEAGGDND